jgi:hypothetical protein
MARPSPAALDVMEHIADAMDALDGVIASTEAVDARDSLVRVSQARELLREAHALGAEVLLELLTLSERHELMQSEMDEIRGRPH